MVGARAREAGAVAAGALQLVVGGERVEGNAAGGGVVEAGAFGGVVGGEGAALLGGEGGGAGGGVGDVWGRRGRSRRRRRAVTGPCINTVYNCVQVCTPTIAPLHPPHTRALLHFEHGGMVWQAPSRC